MDAITEFVSTKNKTPLNLMTRITLPDQSTIKLDKNVTMGMLSQELKDNRYFVVVNARTGVDKSDLMKMTQLQNQLAITPPGTPEYAELYRRAAEIRGLDMTLQSQPVPEAPVNNPQAPPNAQMSIPGRVTPDNMAKLMDTATQP